MTERIQMPRFTLKNTIYFQYIFSIWTGLFLFAVFNIPHNVYAHGASYPWKVPSVPADISKNILYVPIAHSSVKSIPIKESGEELIDLIQINHPRLLPMHNFGLPLAYEGCYRVRKGLYEALIRMLDFLPQDVGIAYSEGYRPLAQQKLYFDKSFKKNLALLKNKEAAYEETCKFVSPFIDNVPTHTTGAAIDMTLFRIVKGNKELIDMGGKYDTTDGKQQTFCSDLMLEQRENRLMFVGAATKADLVNYGYEWWHYSYKDRAWALVKQKEEASYGLPDMEKGNPLLQMTKESYLQNQ